MSVECMKGLFTLMHIYIGTPKNIYFPFGTNGKLMILGVPIIKHIMVLS